MRRSLLLLIGVGLGLLVGAAATHTYYRQVLKAESNKWLTAMQVRGDRWLLGDLTSAVLQNVTTLTGLRRGSIQDLIQDKEEALNEAISELFSNYPAAALTNNLSLKVLRMAARYRADHPFESGDPAVNQAVRDALAAVRPKNANSDQGLSEK